MAEANDCGCCAGATAETPAVKSNPPGLPAIVYRAGTQRTFLASLLSRLSSRDYPALADLTTRSNDDWTVALCDAFACVADLLTFYQERIANEAYLRTATERRSVLELARLIGYRPAPGVAASTSVAFTLEAAPGQPDLAAQPVTIPVGTRVQSVPDPGQDPQTFETVAAIMGRVEWNDMPAQASQTMAIAQGLTELYIDGTSSQIQPGDALLIVGTERVRNGDSDRWDIRWLDRVEADPVRKVTRLVWSKPLGSQWHPSPPAALGVHVYVFRQRAALFGNSAPDPNLIYNRQNKSLFSGSPPGAQWPGFKIDETGKAIDLDAAYPKIVVGSWVALTGGQGGTEPTGYVELYHVVAISQLSRTAFGLSSKTTRVQCDSSENLDKFDLRETQVLAQSEELTTAPRPLLFPVFGSTLKLGRPEPDLAPGQVLAVRGKRQRIVIPADTTGISFPLDASRTLQPGESFLMLAAPETQIGTDQVHALEPEDLDPFRPAPNPADIWSWSVQDRSGATLTIQAPAGSLLLQPALKDDDMLSEVIAIAKGAAGVKTDLDSTTLTLVASLANCYDRSTVTVNANVAPATHGETVTEIAGSGDASQPNQRFQLKQSPLTYVSDASDPGGAVSTLQVRVNDLQWTESKTLYSAGARDRVYALRQDDDAKTAIEFGDGDEGARLPTAQNNVRLVYRKGLGGAGNLRTSQLTMLLTRPLGVKAVDNPIPATGGQDAEPLAEARRNAPVHVLTLERAVSPRDYADFARTFAGISKAHAVWINDGRARGIYLTIAGAKGDPVPDGSATQRHLVTALRQYGDPLLPLCVQTYGCPTFALKARVRIAANADPDATLAAVTTALRAAYAFEAREFGQPVTIDEVYAVLQHVAGVIAADVQQLYRSDAGPAAVEPQPRLLAALPAVHKDGTVNAAEILTLNSKLLSLAATTEMDP